MYWPDGKGICAVKKVSILIGWLVTLALAPGALAQLQLGDNWHINAGALLTLGYQSVYGNDDIQDNHGITLGADATVNGYFYSPSFANFTVTPYYGQDRLDSDSQSLTSSSGVAATLNLFSGTRFPGSISYNYTHNSTGLFGLEGAPNFTTVGNGQGFGLHWSALVPDWPSLSVGYQQGSGSGNIYGTDQETSSNNHILNVNSTYVWHEYRLNAYYNYTNMHFVLPEFLSGETQDSTTYSDSNSVGLNVSHKLPINGQFYVNYNRSDVNTNYFQPFTEVTGGTNYITDNEAGGVTFHPNNKLMLYADEDYSSNLSGVLYPPNGGTGTPVDLGTNSHSFTVGGGAAYTFPHNIITQGTATYYNQSYYGQNYTGTFVSGSLNYAGRLWNILSFGLTLVDSANGQGNNNVGFIVNANALHNFGRWETTGYLGYNQNVQSELVTYTTSYYNYSATVRRHFRRYTIWSAAFYGNHSGINQQAGSSYGGEAYATSLSWYRLGFNAIYSRNSGNSLITPVGTTPLPPTPGVPSTYIIQFMGDSYGAGLSWAPMTRLSISANYNRSISNTLSNATPSNNNTEIYFAQLVYHIRRVGFQAGYERFTQGITAVSSTPVTSNSYYFGISRYFDFF